MTNTIRCVATLAAWPVILLCIVLTGCAARPAPAAPAPRATVVEVTTHAPDIAIVVFDDTLDFVGALVETSADERAARARCAAVAEPDSDLYWECVDAAASEPCGLQAGL